MIECENWQFPVQELQVVWFVDLSCAVAKQLFVFVRLTAFSKVVGTDTSPCRLVILFSAIICSSHMNDGAMPQTLLALFNSQRRWEKSDAFVWFHFNAWFDYRLGCKIHGVNWYLFTVSIGQRGIFICWKIKVIASFRLLNRPRSVCLITKRKTKERKDEENKASPQQLCRDARLLLIGCLNLQSSRSLSNCLTSKHRAGRGERRAKKQLLTNSVCWIML